MKDAKQFEELLRSLLVEEQKFKVAKAKAEAELAEMQVEYARESLRLPEQKKVVS